MPIFSPEQLKQFAAEVSTASPQRDERQQAEGLGFGYKAGLVGSNLFDAATTRMALRSNPNTREGNPAMKDIASSTPGLLALKGGTGLLESYLLDRISRDHPRLARILAIGGIVFPTAAGISNLSKVK